MATPEAKVHPLSVEDVYRMVEAGILGEDDRVELIDGVLVDMTAPSAAHSAAVAWLTRHFAAAVSRLEVRVQDVLLVEGGFFVPDLMVVEPPPRNKHPDTAKLVIEVAVTTHRHDAWKAERYARAGVDEYWIVDLPAGRVRTHRQPRRDGYAESREHVRDERVPTPVGAPPVPVADLVAG